MLAQRETLKTWEIEMKITDVKLSDPWYVHGKESTDATVVNPAIRATSLLEITTDEGVSGFTAVSELLIGPQDGSLKKLLIDHAFKPLVVGEDPLDTERIWDKMYWGSVRWGRRGVAPRETRESRGLLSTTAQGGAGGGGSAPEHAVGAGFR